MCVWCKSNLKHDQKIKKRTSEKHITAKQQHQALNALGLSCEIANSLSRPELTLDKFSDVVVFYDVGIEGVIEVLGPNADG